MKKINTMLFSVILIFASCTDESDDVSSLIEEDRELSSIQVLDIMELKTTYEHNAFTDIQKFNDELFICFRSSDKHVYGDEGVITVFKSSDLGNNWELIHTQQVEGVDLRDPKFVLNKDGHFFLYIHGTVYDGENIKGRLDYRLQYNSLLNRWEDLSDVNIAVEGDYNGVWPWRIEWSRDTAYVFGYGPDKFDLYYSLNGLNFIGSNIDFNIDPAPNEVTIRYKNGHYYAVIRKKGPTYFMKSNLPIKKWVLLDSLEWNNIGGPDFRFYNSHTILLAGRKWASDYKSQKFLIANYNLESKKLDVLNELPGEMDLGYPGMLINKDLLFMSYYSTKDDSTRVFFVKIELNFL